MQCSFGTSSSTLNVLPANRKLVNNLPMANINANAVYSRNRCAMGARFANNHGWQRTGAECAVQTHLRLGRSDSNQLSGTSDDGGDLNIRTATCG